MDLTTVEKDQYWKRRQVGIDYDGHLLHEHLEVGAFVMVEVTEGPHWPKDCVQYRVVGKYNRWDTITKRLFTIFFERVRQENEIGLIKLIEQPDS